MIVEANSLLYRHALQIFHSMWETTGKNGRLPPIFPGPQPISIERVHFAKLKSNPYVVCEKTDGVRIVLLAFLFENKKVTLLINRSLQMTQISLNLPKSAHRGTLLDGELVEKTLMIYDGVWVSGEDIKQKNFLDRLEKIELFIRGIMRLAKDPIMVRLKKFVTLNELENFQKNVVPNLPYETDGLVFTPVNDPVRLGTHENMFKWKPRDQNTIDFQVKFKPDGTAALYIQDRGSLIYESEVSPSQMDLSWLHEDCIVECQYMVDTFPLWWKPLKIRTDKNYPNNRRTFYRTMVNVQENIQWEEFTRL